MILLAEVREGWSILAKSKTILCSSETASESYILSAWEGSSQLPPGTKASDLGRERGCKEEDDQTYVQYHLDTVLSHPGLRIPSSSPSCTMTLYFM